MSTPDLLVPQNPSENPIVEFPKLRLWAVVGVSTDQGKYGNKIYRDLKNAGYTVYGVNPKLSEIEGDPCYPSIKDLPEVPDVVNVVVPPVAAMAVVEDCLTSGVQRIWFQPGAENPEAIEKATQAGMIVVADACIMIQKQEWAD